MTLNILIAFPFCSNALMADLATLGEDLCFLLDSGAFSAFTSGTDIRLDDYCRFIERLQPRPWRYFNLDVIGDASGSERNYQTMLDRGFRPVPIFTRDAPLDVLDRMYETTDVVGIGGLIIKKTTAYRYTKAVMQHVAGRPVHLLGLTNPDWIQYFRPYSCDSTSFGRATRYGQMDVYLGDGRFARYYSGTRKKETGTNNSVNAGPPNATIRGAIAAMGFDPYALQSREHWQKSWGLARWISAYSWVRYAAELEARTGTRLFLAGARDDLLMLAHCYRAIIHGTDIEQARRASIKPLAA